MDWHNGEFQHCGGVAITNCAFTFANLGGIIANHITLRRIISYYDAPTVVED